VECIIAVFYIFNLLEGIEKVTSETPIPTSVCSTGSDTNVHTSSCSAQTRKQTSLVNSSASAPPAELSTCYSDTLPVRVVGIKRLKHDYERNFSIPYSHLFKNMEKMLANPTALEDLYNEENECYDRDRVLLFLSLTEYLQTKITELESMFEVAPLVRLGCMYLSISEQFYETEIITRRIIRGFEQTAYLGCEITQETRRTPVSNILACTLGAFTTFMFNNTGSMDPDTIFLKSQYDKEWTAVPISYDFLYRSSAVPYIASFLTSEFYNGKVNHVYRGYYSNAERTRKTEAVIRTIPSANSVFLGGPKNIILVLVNDTNSSYNSNVKLFNFDIPVYTGAAQVKPVQFGQIWDAWWCNSNLRQIESDLMGATNEVENHLAVKNAADIATSMLAELYSAAYLGIAVEPNQESMTYNWQVPVSGGWSLYPNDKIAGSSAKLNYWSTADGDDQIAARRRITGYNFSALTCWHRPSTGEVNTESQASIFPNAGQMRVWSDSIPNNSAPGYFITTVGSLIRICFYAKLIFAHDTRMIIRHLDTRIHLLSVAMGAQTSLIFSQTNLSLSVWSGYLENRLLENMMEKVLKVATLGISCYSRRFNLHNTYCKRDAIFKYYAMDPFHNINWYSYTPFPHHLVQQWSSKINMRIGNDKNRVRCFGSRAGNQHFGILISKETLQYRSTIACTISTDDYFPMVAYRPVEGAIRNMMAWVDNWSFLSKISAFMDNYRPTAALASNELVLPMVDNIRSLSPDSLYAYIVGSPFEINCPDYHVTYFSELEWPCRC